LDERCAAEQRKGQACIKPHELPMFALIFPISYKRHLLIIWSWELFVCIYTENFPRESDINIPSRTKIKLLDKNSEFILLLLFSLFHSSYSHFLIYLNIIS
jgi:hypothetical protein